MIVWTSESVGIAYCYTRRDAEATKKELGISTDLDALTFDGVSERVGNMTVNVRRSHSGTNDRIVFFVTKE